MKYQPHVEFRAQALPFRSLMYMFERLKVSGDKLDPYDVLPAVVFMAFTLEAYINSIGARKVVFWDHLERLPWKKKIDILHEAAGRTPNWGSMPLQLADEIFKIRDQLAHGKGQVVAGPILDSNETASAMLQVQYLKPPMLEGLDRAWLLKSGEQLYVLLEYLGVLFRLDEDDFASFSWGYIKRIND